MIRTMQKNLTLRKTSLKLSLNIVDTTAFSRRFSDINKILLDKNSKIPPRVYNEQSSPDIESISG